jgi:hypothetical protein
MNFPFAMAAPCTVIKTSVSDIRVTWSLNAIRSKRRIWDDSHSYINMYWCIYIYHVCRLSLFYINVYEYIDMYIHIRTQTYVYIRIYLIYHLTFH